MHFVLHYIDSFSRYFYPKLFKNEYFITEQTMFVVYNAKKTTLGNELDQVKYRKDHFLLHIDSNKYEQKVTAQFLISWGL